jgi:hypothetical protein
LSQSAFADVESVATTVYAGASLCSRGRRQTYVRLTFSCDSHRMCEALYPYR